MVDSIQNHVLTSTSNSQYGQTAKTAKTAKTSETTQAEGKKEKPKTSQDGSTITSIDGDTLSISSAGAAYAEKAAVSGVSQGMKDAAPAVTSDSVVSAAPGATKGIGVNAQASVKTETDTAASRKSEETESATEDLSEYRDFELEQMLNSGEITQSEYDDEMEDRNGVMAAIEE